MRVYGNLMNRIAETVPPSMPEVGMGATILMWSDRHAATIIEVLSPCKIVIQQDTPVRKDKNGMSEAQDYIFLPNPDGVKYVVTKRKNGAWYKQGDTMRGTIVSIGKRDEYHDYSF